ncbi:putative uncharacterized protein DDB_G0271606 isoform X2 [Procambarus clarkii]
MVRPIKQVDSLEVDSQRQPQRQPQEQQQRSQQHPPRLLSEQQHPQQQHQHPSLLHIPQHQQLNPLSTEEVESCLEVCSSDPLPGQVVSVQSLPAQHSHSTSQLTCTAGPQDSSICGAGSDLHGGAGKQAASFLLQQQSCSQQLQLVNDQQQQQGNSLNHQLNSSLPHSQLPLTVSQESSQTLRQGSQPGDHPYPLQPTLGSSGAHYGPTPTSRIIQQSPHVPTLPPTPHPQLPLPENNRYGGSVAIYVPPNERKDFPLFSTANWSYSGKGSLSSGDSIGNLLTNGCNKEADKIDGLIAGMNPPRSPPVAQFPQRERIVGVYGLGVSFLGQSPKLVVNEDGDSQHLYTEKNHPITMVVTHTAGQSASLRLLLVFAKDSEASQPVHPCKIHQDPAHPKHMVVVDGGVETVVWGEAPHPSIVVTPPPSHLQQYSVVIKFLCRNSCLTRRDLSLVVQLEQDGGVVGREALSVKISACPKRDSNPRSRKTSLHHEDHAGQLQALQDSSLNQFPYQDSSANEQQFQDSSVNQQQFQDSSANQQQFQDSSANQQQFQDSSANQQQFQVSSPNLPVIQVSYTNPHSFQDSNPMMQDVSRLPQPTQDSCRNFQLPQDRWNSQKPASKRQKLETCRKASSAASCGCTVEAEGGTEKGEVTPEAAHVPAHAAAHVAAHAAAHAPAYEAARHTAYLTVMEEIFKNRHPEDHRAAMVEFSRWWGKSSPRPPR